MFGLEGNKSEIINMPEIAREAKEEFYRVNSEVQMARVGSDKYDRLMQAGVASIIHERHGKKVLKMYTDYLLKEY